jgi:hypothetical protein
MDDPTNIPAPGRDPADAAPETTNTPSQSPQAAPGSEPGARGGPEKASPQKQKSANTAARLLELVNQCGAELYTDQTGRPYIAVEVNGHPEHWPVDSRQFKEWLGMAAYRLGGDVANSNTVEEAVRVLCARAKVEGRQREVYVRVGWHDGSIYLDLCDAARTAVKISRSGWGPVDRHPVSFRRPEGMLALPEPVRGGSLDELGDLLNLGDERNRDIVIGWLIGVMRARGPYPPLVINGEQGSGKTDTARGLRYLVDPHALDGRPPPVSEQELLLIARNNHVVAFDNVSEVPGWLSDALCRLATGAALSRRKLYTDDEEVQVQVTRPAILNGINADMISGPDLLDRATVIEVPSIPDERRLPEEAVWGRLEEARPRLLGALLDAVVTALQRQGTVKLPRLPRMADFALWVEAASPALGWQEGEFTELFFQARDEADMHTLTLWPVMEPLEQILRGHEGAWEGTVGELLEELNGARSRSAGPPPADWPRSPRWLGGQLRRHEPLLRRVGIEVSRPKRSNGGRMVRIVRREAEPRQPSPGPCSHTGAEGDHP